MSEFKIFTFHTMTDGWRVEVYDLNNRLVKVCKVRDGDDARALVEAYRARFARSGNDSDGFSPAAIDEQS